MNKLLFLFSLWLAKFISFIISILHLGQSSNVPGRIALSFKKDILKDFKTKEKCKIILITGTNGKSTTCGLLANILKGTGKKVIYNKSGANLLSGITSTFCNYSNIFGVLNYDDILLEVDEASLHLITKQIHPDIIAVTNLFRDQLDRFGELDSTARLIEKGIAHCHNATIILNADDVRVAFLKTESKKVYFGINTNAKPHCEEAQKTKAFPHNDNAKSWCSDPEEITTCPECKSDLSFLSKSLAHLGDYSCTKCSLKRPELNFAITKLKTDHLTTNFDIIQNILNDRDSNTFINERICPVNPANPIQHNESTEGSSSLSGAIKKNNYFLPMIGIFNLYNALCAIAIARTISSVTHLQIQKALDSYSTIFGRGEKITLNKKNAWIYLIKNPTGTTEVLKTLTTLPNARFLIAINDNYADGRDVSWLWDARFDYLQNHGKNIFVAGKRAYDMALRLKYADIHSEHIHVNENITKAINKSLKSLNTNETLYILPTYTVLLEMQRKGICKSMSLN